MLEGLTLRERDEILARLGQTFEASAAEALVDVLDRVVAWRAEMVTRQDFQELQRLMGQVLEGQRVLQEAVATLTEAQARTEERVGRLEDAQIRTEERMGRLEEALARLAEAQAETQKELRQLSRQVGGLSDRMGGDLEKRGRRAS